MNSNRTYISLFDLADEFLRDFDLMAPSKLPDTFVSSTFPPANILKTEDNSLQYEFAVAGYKEDEISIKFDNDHLFLSLEPKEDEDSKVKYRQRGIKKCKSHSKFFVPISHFDVEKAEAKLENGILYITIPSKEVAKPKTLEIKLLN